MSSTRAPLLRPVDRQILTLAVPAFLALVAEPLFLLADAAVVGHLGTTELAGLGIAGTIVATLVGLCIFLAYGTTAGVARRIGAGHTREAMALGVDGLWLAVAIGVPVTVVAALLSDPLVAALGARGEVADAAASYLGIAVVGITPLLLMLAATGVLRGLADTRTPLAVAVAGNLVNVLLNVLLVFGLGPAPELGLRGSALGSVVAQVLSAAVLVAVVARAARRHGASLRPDLAGIRAAGRAGVPLLIRTLTLRAALLVTTYAVVVGAGSGDDAVPVAAHQLAMTIWGFLAFVLDAIAIAAQTLVGQRLGAGDAAAAKTLTRRMMAWGLVSGVVTGLALAAVSPWIGRPFTPDTAVQDALVPVMLVAALAQPVAGIVFVLDGILIGAGDGRYLALVGVIVLAGYAPLVLLASSAAPAATVLTWVWVAFCTVFMGGRLVTLVHREYGDRWLLTGAGEPR